MARRDDEREQTKRLIMIIIIIIIITIERIGRTEKGSNGEQSPACLSHSLSLSLSRQTEHAVSCSD